eukprot:812881-Rhodomonas_salina.2
MADVYSKRYLPPWTYNDEGQKKKTTAEVCCLLPCVLLTLDFNAWRASAPTLGLECSSVKLSSANNTSKTLTSQALT